MNAREYPILERGIIGLKSYKNDVYLIFLITGLNQKSSVYAPKPQTRDIGGPFYGNESTKSPK